MLMPDYEVLLFDLIGVVVKVNPKSVDILFRLTGFDEEKLFQIWLTSPTARAFDLGRIPPDEYASGMIREMGLPLKPDEFLAMYRQSVLGLYDGTVSLLNRLKGRYRLVCLSNLNEILWPPIRDEFRLGQLLDAAYLSFEIGLLKPEEEIYRYVLDRLECLPGAVAFFDDSESNVATANRLGIDGYLVQGIAEVQAQLERIGIAVT
jgi:putative hydrolase of the HAD superfamily